MKPFRRKDSSSQTMKRDKIVVGDPSTPYLRPNLLRLHESLLCRAQLGLKLYYESYRISTYRGSQNCGQSANGYRLNDRVDEESPKPFKGMTNKGNATNGGCRCLNE
ncbi:MAG: hypothetical protein WBY22_01540 [Nitrososphaeraceae archaeon]